MNTYNELEESELLEAYKSNNDEFAFSVFYMRHRDYLQNYADKIYGRANLDTERAVSEAFVAVTKNNITGSAIPFLKVVIKRNLARQTRDNYRLKRAILKTTHLEQSFTTEDEELTLADILVDPNSVNPCKKMIVDEFYTEVEKAKFAIPPIVSECVVMFYCDGQGIQTEICRDTSRHRAKKGLGMLRESLKQVYGEFLELLTVDDYKYQSNFKALSL